jgi:hypothetical protein
MEINTLLVTLVVGVASIGTAYGVLRASANRNAADINRMVPEAECKLKHDAVVDALAEMKTCVRQQQQITGQLKNFALYQLTAKDKMSLPDAKNVLENGGD